MKTKKLWAGLCLLLLSACGPMIGGMMVSSNEVKDFKVVQGNLSDLRPGSHAVVIGPFDKTPEAFYICRGEEAAAFTTAFNLSGLFKAELEVETRFPDKLPQARHFKGQTPREVQKELGLEMVPSLVVSGTILSREMVAAPAQGVIMTASYRLEFLDLESGEITIIEVLTKELFQDVIPQTVEYMLKQIIS